MDPERKSPTGFGINDKHNSIVRFADITYVYNCAAAISYGMDQTLSQAYKIVFGAEPEPAMENWQVAERLLDCFDVPKLGEKSAKQCIFRIVNHIEYPDIETTRRIIGQAEGLASELWDELRDEPHMAEIERLEYREYEESQQPR